MKKTLTTLALTSALVLTTAAYAGNGPRDMMGPAALLNDRGAERLALTDDQQVRISELIELHRSQYPQGDAKEAFAQKREAMDALMTEPEFDESAARALLSEDTERRLAGMKLRHDLAQVLTDGQREKLEKMRERQHKKGRNSKGRDGERRGGKPERY